jgi:hypothetical protein
MLTHELLELHNETSELLSVWIEPWGAELFINPGATWQLIEAGKAQTKVAVTYRRESISVHVSPEARIFWMDCGQVIWNS